MTKKLKVSTQTIKQIAVENPIKHYLFTIIYFKLVFTLELVML